jgi:hypothetical protein
MNEKNPNTGYIDPMVLQSVYPEAGAIFSFQPEPLQRILSGCLVVLDTNVLLIPYNTGKDSLEQIRRTYSVLTSQRRLIVPGQAAREFARIRPEKLRAVFQQLSRKRDISIKRQEYPLLESVPEYQEVVRVEQELETLISGYRKKLGFLLDTISAWHWNDPVSVLYRDLFGKDVIYDPDDAREGVLEDLEHRRTHKIPPGYKDAGKDDGGVGDLLIWRTVLELGKSREMHVVFVSGDEKADWWYQSENQALFPRFELIDEFRRASAGKTLHIISFADLLKSFGASEEVVQEVRNEEIAGMEGSGGSPSLSYEESYPIAEKAVLLWLREHYPLGEIEMTYRGVDFIVRDSVGRIGFEVKLVRSQEYMRDLIRAASITAMQAVALYKLNWAYVVIVLAREVPLALIISRYINDQRPISPSTIGVVIGVVGADGKFKEVYRQEPELSAVNKD